MGMESLWYTMVDYVATSFDCLNYYHPAYRKWNTITSSMESKVKREYYIDRSIEVVYSCHQISSSWSFVHLVIAAVDNSMSYGIVCIPCWNRVFVRKAKSFLGVIK